MTASFTIGGTLHCSDVPITFTDLSSPSSVITKRQWKFGDGSAPVTNPPAPVRHTYTLPDYLPVTDTVTLTIWNINNDSTVISKLITLKPNAPVQVASAASCINDSVSFHVITDSTYLGITSFIWKFNDTLVQPPNTDTTTVVWNPKYKYPRKGKYMATLRVTNLYGCMHSDTSMVTIGLPPVAAFKVPDPVCARQFFTVTDASKPQKGSVITSRRWNFNNEITLTTKNPEYRFWYAGTYPISLIIQDTNHCYDTAVQNIRVLPLPIGKFTLTENYDKKPGQVKFNNFTDASSFYWDFGNFKHSTLRDPITDYLEDGTYTVKLISSDTIGCADTTFYLYKVLFKGLYVPNAFSPTSSILGIRLFQPVGANLGLYHVQVFDSWGHLMWESTALDDKGVPTEGWDGTFEGNLMPQGNYLWKINARFKDDSQWGGSDIGVGTSTGTMGTVVLIR